MIYFILGVVAGWFVHAGVMAYRVTKLMQAQQDVLRKTVEEIKRSITYVNVETVDGRVFVYETDTNKFLAQGDSIKHVADTLKQQYPGRHFFALNVDKDTYESL